MNSRNKQNPNSEALGAIDSLRRIAQVIRSGGRRDLSADGLTAAQHLSLSRLAEEKVMSLNELAARTLTHQSSVSIVVSKLVERGLVRRARCATDRRQHELSVTPAGRAALRKFPAENNTKLLRALRRLRRTELRQLAKLLRRLVDGLTADG